MLQEEHHSIRHAKPLHPLPDIRVYRFPMPDAKNPYLGLDHLEHDPEITYAELPLAFQGLSQKLPVLKCGLQVLRWPYGYYLLIFGQSGAGPHHEQRGDSVM